MTVERCIVIWFPLKAKEISNLKKGQTGNGWLDGIFPSLRNPMDFCHRNISHMALVI